MKTAFRHIQNDCVLCHANKVRDVGPMAERLHITTTCDYVCPVAPPSLLSHLTPVRQHLFFL